MPRKKTTTGVYGVFLFVAGQKFEYHVDDVEDALQKFSPHLIKGKGVLKIEKDGRSKELLMPQGTIRRLAFNKIARQIWAKRLLLALG